MDPWRFELAAVLLITLALALHAWSWGPPATMSRDDYVRVLIEAGTQGSTPRATAVRLGFAEGALGRAAHAYGDLESERRVAEGLGAAREADSSGS